MSIVHLVLHILIIVVVLSCAHISYLCLCFQLDNAGMQPLWEYIRSMGWNDHLDCMQQQIFLLCSEQALRIFFGNWNINNKWTEQHVVDLDGCDKSSWHHYRGTSGLDIDLRVVDINQCHANTSSFNIFGGTDKCKKETTTVNILSRTTH